MKKARLHIRAKGDVGQYTSIHLVGEDGSGNRVSQDITAALRVTDISMSLKVGEPNRAQLTCLCFRGEIDALLDDLAIAFAGRNRFRAFLWRLRKWWWGVKRGGAHTINVADVTTVGKAAREYVES